MHSQCSLLGFSLLSLSSLAVCLSLFCFKTKVFTSFFTNLSPNRNCRLTFLVSNDISLSLCQYLFICLFVSLVLKANIRESLSCLFQFSFGLNLFVLLVARACSNRKGVCTLNKHCFLFVS